MISKTVTVIHIGLLYNQNRNPPYDLDLQLTSKLYNMKNTTTNYLHTCGYQCMYMLLYKCLL